MRTFLIRVAYDGTDFSGYQVQRQGERTVQAVLERALHELHGHPVHTVVAGRTDSGVHAVGQHVSFESDRDSIPEGRMAAAITSRLPRDVAVLNARVVEPGFHARYSAVSRHYRYHLVVAPIQLPHLRNYTWAIPFSPDVERVDREAQALIGRHDFSTFAARREPGADMVRTVLYLRFQRDGERLVCAIGADGFLWHMVRSIVGTLVAREQRRQRGDVVAESMAALLTARDRARAGTTAPASGLFLHDVEYDL
ncbi:MAG: tRNA pseudouridine(38-40) synthase TruA [Alkalispirochaeta sp.]